MPAPLARLPAIVAPAEYSTGPAMAQLTENQRNYVWALVQTGGDEPRAADLAGYGGNPNSRDVALFHLRHNPKVLAAIKEVAEGEIKSIAFLGAKALREIVGDPGHKDRAKVAIELLNRAGLIVVQEAKLTIEHKNPDLAATVARIRAMAEGLGMDPKPLLLQAGVPGEVIDAEFEVVTSGDLRQEVDEWTVQPQAS